MDALCLVIRRIWVSFFSHRGESERRIHELAFIFENGLDYGRNVAI